MKLKTLAGFGPQAALVSGAIMVVIVVAQQVTNAITFSPATLTIIQISFFVVLVLLMATLTVTVFDLESLEHPRTSTPWFRVAQATMLAATVMPVVIAVSWFAQVGLA
ncbi:MAG TPA: hypothetical protein VHO95_05015, partial [Candidatus Dormibacteraeota bacterium]|nr:hypothetical protein [Candidatus Dormibacteraeota bacterium]